MARATIEAPNVVVRIRGRQTYEGQEPETIELTTEGKLSEKDGALLLSYAESELTGLEGTVTSFELRGDRIRLTRYGRFNSAMEFAVGQVDESLYNTGMGALLVTIRTLAIENHLDAHGGNLRVTYKISIENFGCGQIEYDVLVTEI